jgi:NADH dehydrogenase
MRGERRVEQLISLSLPKTQIRAYRWCSPPRIAGGTVARCETRSRRTVKVGVDLSVPSHPDIFVVGDTAAVTDQPGIPGTAPPAKQMGRYVGRLIAARVAGGPSPPPFRYRDLGDLATIGRGAAVVKLGRLELTGFVGWLFWSVVHIYFLITVRDRFIVAFTWLWDYVTFQRGARLITEVPPERK